MGLSDAQERFEPDGSIALVFNSQGMFRGAADAGRFEVKNWE